MPGICALCVERDVAKFPDMSLRLWVGSPSKASPGDRLITLNKLPDALKEHVGQFKDEDPRTALQIVLTTYQTFHIRTIFFENAKGKGRADDGVEGRDEEDVRNDGEKSTLSTEELRTISTKVAWDRYSRRVS